MAVVELGWTAEQYWHSSWHEFHGAVQYLAEKRRREAETVRGARRPGFNAATRGDAPKVKVKGQPEQVLGGSPVITRTDDGGGSSGQPFPWVRPEFAQFREEIYSRFGKRLVGWG